MKIVLFAIFALFILVPPSFGQIFDVPGLKQTFDVKTGGYFFEVTAVSNFEVQDFEFSEDEKRLTFFINSGSQNNISEIQIPKNLINGNFTFYLNGSEVFPSIKQNDKISFIVLEFAGNGTSKLDIIGTTYLPEFADIAQFVLAFSLFGIIFLAKKRFIFHQVRI